MVSVLDANNTINIIRRVILKSPTISTSTPTSTPTSFMYKYKKYKDGSCDVTPGNINDVKQEELITKIEC